MRIAIDIDTSSVFNSSTPHSAFTDVWGWWRADSFSGSSPNVTLKDKSIKIRNIY